ncbi:MAG: RNA-binding protein [Nitrososphaerota archaeon]|nr:RNA-binding protein [Nitrososphaerota archaeon]MDG7025848.1 RNA-binding protein [Nitrososphaerota archaeon]
MKRWVLSHRDSVGMIAKLEGSMGVSFSLPKSAQAECAEPEEGIVFVKLEDYELVQSGDVFFPFLGSQPALALFPSVVVDEGAIRFLINGADVMRPGIRKMDDWGAPGKLVVVREEKKGRAIVVGRATVPGAEAESMSKGECVKNLHHVGDRYWAAHKSL